MGVGPMMGERLGRREGLFYEFSSQPTAARDTISAEPDSHRQGHVRPPHVTARGTAPATRAMPGTTTTQAIDTDQCVAAAALLDP